MIVRYGRTVEDGFLPVYSVDTEIQAQALLTFACPINYDKEFVATELSKEQTIDNLTAFGERLHEIYTKYLGDRD